MTNDCLTTDKQGSVEAKNHHALLRNGVGVAVAAVAVVWAATLWAQPVYDLRERSGAIDAYARGVGLAHQSRWQEAIAAFDQALQAAPDYANALVQRASANASLDKIEAAAADYEKARAAGDASANTTGELAWDYYLLGRFDDAVAMNRTALKASPDELWIQFDLALSLLASGPEAESRTPPPAGPPARRAAHLRA